MATGTVEGRLAQLGIALPEVAPAGAPFRVWCVWYRGVPRSPYIENIPQRLLLFFGRADSITQDESPFVAAMQYCSVPFLSMRVRFTRDAVGVVRVVGHLWVVRAQGTTSCTGGLGTSCICRDTFPRHLTARSPRGRLVVSWWSGMLRIPVNVFFAGECLGQTLTVVAPCVEDG